GMGSCGEVDKISALSSGGPTRAECFSKVTTMIGRSLAETVERKGSRTTIRKVRPVTLKVNSGLACSAAGRAPGTILRRAGARAPQLQGGIAIPILPRENGSSRY